MPRVTQYKNKWQCSRMMLVFDRTICDTKPRSDKSFAFDEPFVKRHANCFMHNFFLRYGNGKCWNQVILKITIEKFNQRITQLLELPDFKLYTSLSLRRTSLANAGALLTKLKHHGGWQYR